MRLSIHLLGFTCALLPALTMGADAKVKSRIKSVIVFNDRARVTRVSNAELQPGTNTIDVVDIPDRLVDSTLRVELIDGGAVLQSVEIPREYSKDLDPEKVKAAREKRDTLVRKRNAVNEQRAHIRTEVKTVSSLDIGRIHSERDRKPPVLAPETWKKVMAFALKQQAKQRAELRKLEKELQDLDLDLKVAQSELSKLQAYQRESRKVARIKVRAPKAGKVEFRLSYIVHNCSWYPAYDIHVDPKTGKVSISYFSLVSQRSGEDWSNAEIMMSTAIPAHSADLPQLSKWVIREGHAPPSHSYAQTKSEPKVYRYLNKRPQIDQRQQQAELENNAPLSGRRTNAYQANNEQAGNRGYQTLSINDNFANQMSNVQTNSGKVYNGNLIEANARAIILQGANNEQIVVKLDDVQKLWNKVTVQSEGVNRGFLAAPSVSAGGFDYRFPSARLENVKSDGKMHRILLRTTKLVGKKVYYCAPILSKYSYLQCKTKNTTGAPILAGPANIFLGGDFVGDARIPTTASDALLELSLGIDERVQVTSESSQMSKTVGMLSSSRRTAFENEIRIKNATPGPISVVIEERLPVSQHGKIKVGNYLETEVSEHHGTDKKIPVGVRRWTLDVAKGKTREFSMSYTLDVPEDMQMTFRDKNRANKRFSKGMPAEFERAKKK